MPEIPDIIIPAAEERKMSIPQDLPYILTETHLGEAAHLRTRHRNAEPPEPHEPRPHTIWEFPSAAGAIAWGALRARELRKEGISVKAPMPVYFEFRDERVCLKDKPNLEW